jgi:hypothetical protein
MPWQFSYRALSGTFYMHAAMLVLAVWAAPGAAALVRRLASTCESRAAALAAWTAQGATIGAMLVLCLIYLRGQTAFIYFQF